MSRVKYIAKTEEDFVGMKIKSNQGTVYEILPWDGKRTEKGNVKLYPIRCEVCEKSPVYFDSKFYIRKGDALCGYTPCGCSRSYKMNREQLDRVCTKICEDAGKRFLGVAEYNEKTINKSLLVIYCPIHNTTQSTTSLNSMRGGSYGCDLCAREGISKSKIKTDEYFLSTFKIPDHVSLTRDTITEYQKGYKPYWYLTCDKCSNDKYVKAGLCSGIFKTTHGQLQSGQLPCRCSKSKGLTKEMVMFDIEAVCRKRGYTFHDFVEEPRSYGRAKFTYTCNRGHLNYSDRHKMVTMNYGCKKCSEFGTTYSTPDREDFLYLILLWDKECDIFLKVGRTFERRRRYREYIKEGLLVSEVLVLTGRHEGVYMLEQMCHDYLREEHYVPYYNFGGNKLECFGAEAINTAENYLREMSEAYDLEVVEDLISL